MALGVAEIRDRAERLKAAVARERYEVNAGLKAGSDFAAVYGTHELVTGADVLPVIQRELAEAAGEERRRLRYLLAWVAEQKVEASLASLEDELRRWETEAEVALPGEERRPLRGLRRAVENEPDRARRRELERRRSEKTAEALPLRVELLHREREAVQDLGFGSFMEARERLSGLNIRGLEREAVRVLTTTEDGYRRLLQAQARHRLDVDPAALDRSDVRWLARAPWLDGSFSLAGHLETLRTDLRALGLPLEADGRVRLDLEERPLKAGRSFCAPLRVPEEVVLVVPPTGGLLDCERLLHETGHTLHLAYTDEQLPFEYRSLGDGAVTETFAILFETLLLEPAWVRHASGLDETGVRAQQELMGFLALYRLRRQAARVLYEIELYASDRPGEMGARYAELMSGATGVTYDPRTYLEEVDRGFWVTRQLRAWMLMPVLRRQLHERYADAWYRNPGAGLYLHELFSAGQREDASQLAGHLGVERLSSGRLLEAVGKWAA